MTISATTGTAGDFGVVIAKPIAVIPLYGRSSGVRDFTTGIGGMPEIEDNSCLAFAFTATSTTESNWTAVLSFVES